MRACQDFPTRGIDPSHMQLAKGALGQTFVIFSQKTTASRWVIFQQSRHCAAVLQRERSIVRLLLQTICSAFRAATPTVVCPPPQLHIGMNPIPSSEPVVADTET